MSVGPNAEAAAADSESAGFEDSGLDVWRAFVHAYGGVVRTLESELRHGFGLTIAQYLVLRLLYSAPGRHLRMAQLTQEMRYSSGAATRLVDPLVSAGYVARAESTDDRRSVCVALTDAGLELYVAARPPHVEAIRREFTSRLRPEEEAPVAAFLSRLAYPGDA